MTTIRDLALRAGIRSDISNRELEELQKYKSSKDVPEPIENTINLISEKFDCYLLEIVIRPSDKALVIHLKNLRKNLRNGRFFELAATYFRDRVGQFSSCHVSFIGEVDSVNKLNSLDMIFSKYTPALRNDTDYIKSKIFKIASDFNSLIVKEVSQLGSKN